GCLISLGLLAVVVLLGLGIVFQVPQKLGFGPDPNKLLAQAPDRQAAKQIVAELKAEGLNPTGMTLFVWPVTGADGTLAYVIVDQSAGFSFPEHGDRQPLVDMLIRVVSGPSATAADVRRVAIES